MMGLKPNS